MPVFFLCTFVVRRASISTIKIEIISVGRYTQAHYFIYFLLYRVDCAQFVTHSHRLQAEAKDFCLAWVQQKISAEFNCLLIG